MNTLVLPLVIPTFFHLYNSSLCPVFAILDRMKSFDSCLELFVLLTVIWRVVFRRLRILSVGCSLLLRLFNIVSVLSGVLSCIYCIYVLIMAFEWNRRLHKSLNRPSLTSLSLSSMTGSDLSHFLPPGIGCLSNLSFLYIYRYRSSEKSHHLLLHGVSFRLALHPCENTFIFFVCITLHLIGNPAKNNLSERI